MARIGRTGSNPVPGTNYLIYPMLITLPKYPGCQISMGNSVTTILNSYRIKSISDMEDVIDTLREMVKNLQTKDDWAINKRSKAGMIIEWRAHNLLYFLGICYDRTGSVDLDLNEPWYRKLGYLILSTLYLRW